MITTNLGNQCLHHLELKVAGSFSKSSKTDVRLVRNGNHATRLFVVQCNYPVVWQCERGASLSVLAKWLATGTSKQTKSQRVQDLMQTQCESASIVNTTLRNRTLRVWIMKPHELVGSNLRFMRRRRRLKDNVRT